MKRAIRRAAVYCRVSTNAQEDNFSLPSQESACRALAEREGYAIVGVYKDVHTGAELWERPQLSIVREMMRAGEIDALVCLDPDRLSRRQVHQAIMLDEAERFGVVLAFVNGSFDTSAIGVFLASARAFAAELEREKFKERSQRGLLERAKSGLLRPGARPLYGYQWADGRKGALVIDPDTSPIVIRIFDRAVAGASLRKIAGELTADAIPTPTGRAVWSMEAVRAILAHKGYTGYAVANGTISIKRRGRATWVTTPRPECEHIALPEGTIPPLVGAATFEAAQARLQRNREQSSRNSKHPEYFLLRGGIVRCGYCGRAVATKYTEKQKTYYQADQRSRGGPDCPAMAMDSKSLDAIVWGAIVNDVILTDRAIKRAIEVSERDDRTADEVAGIEALIADVERRQGRLALAIQALGGEDGEDDDGEAAEPLIAQLRQLAERKKELRAERAERQAARESQEARRAHLRTIAAWRERVAGNLDNLTYGDKRDILAALQVTVKLYRADHDPRWEVFAAIDPEGEPFLIAAGNRADTTYPGGADGAIVTGKAIPSGRNRSPIRLYWSQRDGQAAD